MQSYRNFYEVQSDLPAYRKNELEQNLTDAQKSSLLGFYARALSKVKQANGPAPTLHSLLRITTTTPPVVMTIIVPKNKTKATNAPPEMVAKPILIKQTTVAPPTTTTTSRPLTSSLPQYVESMLLMKSKNCPRPPCSFEVTKPKNIPVTHLKAVLDRVPLNKQPHEFSDPRNLQEIERLLIKESDDYDYDDQDNQQPQEHSSKRVLSLRETKRRRPTVTHPIEQYENPPASENFYFCKTQGSHLLQLPRQNAICLTLPSNPQHWKSYVITLYSKISEPIPLGNIFACTRKVEEIDYYENLLGDPFPTPIVRNSIVSIPSCREMRDTHRAPEDAKPDRILSTQGDQFFATSNKPEVKYKGFFLGAFAGARNATAVNYLLEEIHAFLKPHSMTLFSPIHNLLSCSYKEGSCIVGNFTYIWKPDCQKIGCKQCHY